MSFSININGKLFESLRTGAVVLVEQSELDKRDTTWVDGRELEGEEFSDLRSFNFSELIEAVLPAPKVQLRLKVDETAFNADRGDRFGPCAVQHCQRQGAGWYNHATGNHVCGRCAHTKNTSAKGLAYVERTGHQLCTPTTQG